MVNRFLACLLPCCLLACRAPPEPVPDAPVAVEGPEPASDARVSLYGVPWPAIVDSRPCTDREDCLAACADCGSEACPAAAAWACQVAARRHLAGADLDLEAAVALHRRACEGGHLPACSQLGWLYETGRGTRRDPVAAADLYETACEAGDGLGCLNLGRLHVLGVGLEADPDRAEALYGRAAARFEAACEDGNLGACVDLGRMYDRGQGVRIWPGRASALFADACDAGYAAGCLEIARPGLHVDGHPDEVDSLLAHLCDHDVAEACGLLGARLMTADPAGVEDAILYLRVACTDGFGPACTHLGHHFLDQASGDGPLGDALDLLRRACRLGHAGGCVVLSSFLWQSGLPEATELAKRYLDKACHLNEAAACARLSDLQDAGVD